MFLDRTAQSIPLFLWAFGKIEGRPRREGWLSYFGEVRYLYSRIGYILF